MGEEAITAQARRVTDAGPSQHREAHRAQLCWELWAIKRQFTATIDSCATNASYSTV